MTPNFPLCYFALEYAIDEFVDMMTAWPAKNMAGLKTPHFIF
jgi:hypothetical protein